MRLAVQSCCYREYYRSGGLSLRLGEPERVPFRVLVVFQNAERRNNAAEAMLRVRPPIMQQVWLTTMQELVKHPLDRIWVRPADYREATKCTAFGTDHALSWPYRRRPAREEKVEAAIAKQELLD